MESPTSVLPALPEGIRRYLVSKNGDQNEEDDDDGAHQPRAGRARSTLSTWRQCGCFGSQARQRGQMGDSRYETRPAAIDERLDDHIGGGAKRVMPIIAGIIDVQ